MRIFLILLAAAVAFGVENQWTKVTELKTGTELRIYKTGSKSSMPATFDEANDERIVVVSNKAQIAIEKDGIDRIDARPKAPTRLNKENRTTVTDPKPPRTPYDQTTGPNTSVSSNVTIGSRPDFETIYRRLATLPEKK